MTIAGRNLLYRVESRCAEEYGAALAKADQNPTAKIDSLPFEFIAWHHAIYIVHRLRWGQNIPRPLGRGIR